MIEKNIDSWLNDILPLYTRLTETVVTIIENLLKLENIDYLAVTGRTKNKENILEKIKRKSYKNPQIELTDISGIRIILYLESDVQRTSKIIEQAFEIDSNNSLNKDELMSTNQIGYRSVHYVCHLGANRSSIPEYSNLSGLKFEFQVRTILQHAWAELAHDRNYKFSGTLPKKLERQLYLFAGMLEIADKGFDEVSMQIDEYRDSIDRRSNAGDLDVEIDSISLQRFVELWAIENSIILDKSLKIHMDELVRELREFGLKSLKDINEIIPANYSNLLKNSDGTINIYGIVRDWMLIHDWKKFGKSVNINWSIDRGEMGVLEHYIDPSDIEEFYRFFGEENYMSWEP